MGTNGEATALRRRWWRVVSVAVAASIAIAPLGSAPALADTASSSASPSTGSTASGTTLTASMDGSGIDTLNPFLSYYNASLNTFGMIYPSLTTLDSEGAAIPYLAQSWRTSADQLTWTFTIRSGLKWSDGQPLTAADAAWTLNLIMSNETAATANGSLVENFSKVTAPNATTLVITTKKPQANMLYVSIPISGIPIVPEHIWASHVSDLKDYKNTDFPVVGYGPWSLTNYVTDQYETFKANHGWKNGAEAGPKFDNLVVMNFKNSDSSVAALRSGQLDMDSVSATQFDALKSQAHMGSFQTAGDSWMAVEVNAGAATASGKAMGTGNPILADNTVRKAIHMAIDKNKLVTNLLLGKGSAGAGYLPPAWPKWFWEPSAADKISFNIAAANALLDKAGYAKGSDGIRVDPKTKQKLSFRLGIHADRSDDAAIAALLKGWLAEIGINLQIQSMSMTMLNNNLAKGDWDLLMDAWSTGPDPSYLLSIQTCAARPDTPSDSGMTDSFFCDPQFDKLYAEQTVTLDQAKRQQIIGQMQQILYAANQDIILYYSNTLEVYRSDVLNGIPNGKPNSDGAYPSQNVFDLYRMATPATTKAAAGGSSSAGGIIAGIVAVVVVAAVVIVVVVRRRKTAGDRE